MLDSKLISRLGGKARRVRRDEAVVLAGRQALTRLIDDYWVYHRNPSEYVTVEDPSADTPRYVCGSWTRGESLITHTADGLVVRIPFGGSYLPLTHDGREEIVLPGATLAELEELLASIKHAVSRGRADEFILARARNGASPEARISADPAGDSDTR